MLNSFLVIMPFVFLFLCLSVVFYMYRSSEIRIKKISSESLDGKKLFVVRLNSSDFLFEERNGEVAFLTSIKDPSSSEYIVNNDLENRALHLLELENMGHS